MTIVEPVAFAPYANPEEYILRWTDRIWSGHGMGLIREMYAPDLVVHGAYGDIVGVEAVIRGSIMKHSAFPRRVGTPEDVVWEARGERATTAPCTWVPTRAPGSTGPRRIARRSPVASRSASCRTPS